MIRALDEVERAQHGLAVDRYSLQSGIRFVAVERNLPVEPFLVNTGNLPAGAKRDSQFIGDLPRVADEVTLVVQGRKREQRSLECTGVGGKAKFQRRETAARGPRVERILRSEEIVERVSAARAVVLKI